jgi:hypothetical protein
MFSRSRARRRAGARPRRARALHPPGAGRRGRQDRGDGAGQPRARVVSPRRAGAAARARWPRCSRCFPILWERHRQLGGSLSGGGQQMLAIGRGLMADPICSCSTSPRRVWARGSSSRSSRPSIGSDASAAWPFCWSSSVSWRRSSCATAATSSRADARCSPARVRRSWRMRACTAPIWAPARERARRRPRGGCASAGLHG